MATRCLKTYLHRGFNERMALVTLTLFCLSASQALAGQPVVSESQDPVEDVMGRFNVHPSLEKLGRGISNIFGGWLEIPLNIHNRYRTTDTAGSIFTGMAVGLFKGVARTVVGVYETATFLLPYPENFAPILPTLPYFDKRSGQQPYPFEEMH